MRRSIALTLALICSVALAVTPAAWQHSAEADFSAGEFDSTTVSSRGEIGLARRIEVLMSADKAPPIVSAVVTGKDVVYAASGTGSDIYKISDGKIEKFVSLPGAIITAMIPARADLTEAADAVLLVGTGGEGCGIYAVDAKGKVSKIWVDESVKYVWAMLAGPKGVLYAATGAKAKVIEITDGKAARTIYEANKLAKNILCLARRFDGRLYAGTDEKGLVVEIDPVANSSMIILDAPEKEIAAIVIAPGGGLFVATSDAAKASPDGDTAPAKDKNGKAAEPKAAEPAPDVKTAVQTPLAMAGQSTSAPAADKKAAPSPSEGSAKPELSKSTAATQPSAKNLQGGSAKPLAPPLTPPSPSTSRPAMTRRRPSGKASGPGGPGNAVYLIQPTGLVRTIFRKPVTILSMLLHGDELLLGTGNGGAVYSVTLDGDVVTRLADTDARQITAMSMAPDGRLLLATANKGSVAAMSKALAEQGTFISQALDAKQIALWGTVKCHVQTPAGATVTFATRSGNLAEPDENTWSAWSPEQPLADTFLQIGSPAARFLQYRITLKTDGRKSPLVQDVALIYQVGNLAPAIAAIKVAAVAKPDQRGKGEGAKAFRQLTVAAKDPNGEAIIFKIEFRSVGTDTWVQIAEKLAKPAFVWNTRTVSDGTYEIRVTASDAPANPPATTLEAVRISEPLIVDNTRPDVGKLAVKATGGKIIVSGEATDATSRIVGIHYSVDSADEWTAVLPNDGICDSGHENFSFEVSDLKDGAHRIAVKVTDAYGNAAYASAAATVAK